MQKAGWISAALSLYLLLGIVLIAQKPGLQYDEALLVSDAVHMAHASTVFELDATKDAWVCPFDHCVPLMAFAYVGAIKEYANLPLFAAFGPHTAVIRFIALLFGAFAIWGIYRLINPWSGFGAAVVFAFALAINPAFLNMVVFDNGANGGFMAGLGLTCFGVGLYGTRKSAFAAFWLGAAMGFGIWSRANFLWVVVAGGVSAAIIFRRRVWIPPAHIVAIVLGGLIGGFPFLFYQVVSAGATWNAQGRFALSQPMTLLLRQRLFYLADTLISDGEHRQMWNGPPLPIWQLWLFPAVLLLACVICLFWRGHRLAQFLTLTFLFSAGTLVFSRLPVAEHHLIGVVPLAIATMVLAGAIVHARVPRARPLLIAVALVYAGSCFYWQFETARGLRKTGGVNVWSNSGPELAKYLDHNFSDREIKMLDWGFEFNLYVLTDGRIKAREIFAREWEDDSYSGRPWLEEIRDGGVFLLHGPENREFPKPTVGFLRALAAARPVITQTHRVLQRDGETYAQVIDIAPNSLRASDSVNEGEVVNAGVPMNTPSDGGKLTGFYALEAGRFRWTAREFSARLDLSHLARPVGGGLALRLGFYIPESTIQKLGSMTLTTRFDGHPLAPETISRAGQFILRRHLEDAWIVPEVVQIDFSLDKAVPPSASDGRELGLAVNGVSVGPE